MKTDQTEHIHEETSFLIIKKLLLLFYKGRIPELHLGSGYVAEKDYPTKGYGFLSTV